MWGLRDTIGTVEGQYPSLKAPPRLATSLRDVCLQLEMPARRSRWRPILVRVVKGREMLAPHTMPYLATEGFAMRQSIHVIFCVIFWSPSFEVIGAICGRGWRVHIGLGQTACRHIAVLVYNCQSVPTSFTCGWLSVRVSRQSALDVVCVSFSFFYPVNSGSVRGNYSTFEPLQCAHQVAYTVVNVILCAHRVSDTLCCSVKSGRWTD